MNTVDTLQGFRYTSYRIEKGREDMNATTTTEIENALSFLDICDLACKLTPRITFGSGVGAGHTVMLDLVEFMID